MWKKEAQKFINLEEEKRRLWDVMNSDYVLAKRKERSAYLFKFIIIPQQNAAWIFPSFVFHYDVLKKINFQTEDVLSPEDINEGYFSLLKNPDGTISFMPAIMDTERSKEQFNQLLGALNSPEFELNIITK